MNTKKLILIFTAVFFASFLPACGNMSLEYSPPGSPSKAGSGTDMGKADNEKQMPANGQTKEDTASLIEKIVARAAKGNIYGWYDTPYGKIYILNDGTLARGRTEIVSRKDTCTIEDGKYRQENVSSFYYFDKETGLLKTDVIKGGVFYNGKGLADMRMCAVILAVTGIASLILIFKSISNITSSDNVAFTFFILDAAVIGTAVLGAAFSLIHDLYFT